MTSRTALIRTAANLLLTRRTPVSLVHFVTNRCNCRCPHCFMDFEGKGTAPDGRPVPQLLDAGPERPDELSLDEIRRTTRHMGPCLANVNLTGGEPFLREDLSDIAHAYIDIAGVRTVYVTSNGYFTDRIGRFARELATQDRARLIVSLSIDDFPSEHDRARGVPGIFERAIASYRALEPLAPRVLTVIGMNVSDINHERVDDLYRHLVDDLGIRSITAGPSREEGVFRFPRDTRQAVAESTLKLMDRIQHDMRTGKLSGYDGRAFVGRLLNAKNRIVSRILRRFLVTGEYASPCRAGSLSGVIGADGCVFPCEILDRPMGDLRSSDYDFMRIWQSSAADEVRHSIRRRKCCCEYECALTLNVLGNRRYLPELLMSCLRR